eukprot:gene4097-4652_t
MLNVDDEKHMFVLHMVFRPRINGIIESFIFGWNRHPLRTEGNRCPEHVWTNGMIDLRNRQQLQIREIAENTEENFLEWFGFDPEASNPCEDDNVSQVALEDIATPFSPEEMRLLSQLDVLRESGNYGIDIFLEALEILALIDE